MLCNLNQMEGIVGLRFLPTDEQIINHYLKKKILNPNSDDISIRLVKEVDILKFEPWDLRWQAARQNEDEDWYFFWSPEHHGNGECARKRTREGEYVEGKSCKRSTASGFWKKTGKDHRIMGKDGGEVIGVKRILVFHKRNHDSKGEKIKWVMHEYGLNKIPANKKRFVFVRLKRNPDDTSASALKDNATQQLLPDYENSVGGNIVPEVRRIMTMSHGTSLLQAEPPLLARNVVPVREPPNLPEKGSSTGTCTSMPDEGQLGQDVQLASYPYKTQPNYHHLVSDFAVEEVNRRVFSEMVELPSLGSPAHVKHAPLKNNHNSFFTEAKSSHQHLASDSGYPLVDKIFPQVQLQQPPSESDLHDGKAFTVTEPLNSKGSGKGDKVNSEFDLEEFRNLLLTLRDGESLDSLPPNPYLNSAGRVNTWDANDTVLGTEVADIYM